MRRLLFLMLFGLSPAMLYAQAEKQPAQTKKTDTAVSVLTVMVPDEEAVVKIDGSQMKTPGKKREYETPNLVPGKFYTYSVEVKFAPNNYTTITRTRLITFKAGDAINADFTKENSEDKAVIRYVPTPDDVVLQMLKLGKVGKNDVVYDLGCGDARMVIAAVKDSGAKKGVGIDIDPERITESRDNVKREKLEGKVEIRQGDLLDDKVLEKVAEATVIMIYMGDEFNALIKPKLLKVLKPGTRIISHRFKFGDWKPDESVTVTAEDGDRYDLHVWTVKK